MSIREDVVAEGRRWIGQLYYSQDVRYDFRSGGSADCSSFFEHCLTSCGVADPGDWTVPQYASGTPIDRSELLPGDAVFYGMDGGMRHVVLYVGGGRCLSQGGPGVGPVVCSIDYRSDISGYRRYINEGSSGGDTGNFPYRSTYCVQIDGWKWLDEVHDLEDYAGEYGHPITGIAIKCNDGLLDYWSHDVGSDHGWNKKMCSAYYNIADMTSGFSGNGVPIDLLKCYFHSPNHDAVAQYRFHLMGAAEDDWLDWQRDTDKNDQMDGYAGMKGRQVDGFQIILNN